MSSGDSPESPGSSADGVASPRADASLAHLFQHFPETIVRYDRSGRIASVNDEFVRRTGRTLEQVAGSLPFGWTDDQDLVTDVAEYRQLLGETLATGEPRQLIRTRPATGPLQIYLVRFVPILGADGEVDGAFAVANNVSDLEHAREEIARREHEFRTLSDNRSQRSWAARPTRCSGNGASAGRPGSSRRSRGRSTVVSTRRGH